jgi:hypothetical protein
MCATDKNLGDATTPLDATIPYPSKSLSIFAALPHAFQQFIGGLDALFCAVIFHLHKDAYRAGFRYPRLAGYMECGFASWGPSYPQF